MKNLIILVQVIGLSLLMSCSSKFEGAKAPDQPYGEKSGIVVYKPMEMNGIKAVQTLYFDDYGKKEMRETVVTGSMQGAETKQHSIDIRDGNIAYHFELENKIGDMDRATKDVYKQVIPAEMMEQMNVANLSEKLRKSYNFKEEGTEKVAGIKGIKYSIQPEGSQMDGPITGVHYKNVPLKVTLGTMIIEAEKVDFGSKIAPEKFKIPAGFNVIDADKMQEMQEAPADTSAEVKEPLKK